MKEKQKDGDEPGNTVAGSSDAEFEKLLAEVRSTVSLLLASVVFRAPPLLGKRSMLACTDLHYAPIAFMSIDECSSAAGLRIRVLTLLRLNDSCCVSLQCT